MSITRRSLALGAGALGLLAQAGRAAAETFRVEWASGPRKGWFKGRANVAVPAYQINYITEKQATAVGGFGARTRLTAVLSGPDEAMMRRLADEAHADLKAQLTAAGVPLASDEAARGMIAAAGVPLLPGNKGEGEPGGITIGKSVKVGWVSYGAAAAPAVKGFQNLGQPTGMAMVGLMGVLNKLLKPSVEIDSAVVMPILTVDFVQMEAAAGKSITSEWARTGGAPAFHISQMSPVQCYAAPHPRAGTPGSFWAKKDVVSPTPFVARVGSGEAGVRALSVGDARGDAVVVDLPVWEGLVRDAYRSYNAAIVKGVQVCRS